jgi:EAL domain-containing protein (putative c-di-GMP-specific phosphodiesterase class I)
MFGISVVAEGIERIEEKITLIEMGVTLFQGFLFARPAIGCLTRDEQINWD